MPEEARVLEDNRPEILKDLDSFNTAPEFGMLGVLQEQEAKFREQQKETSEPEPKPEPKEEPDDDSYTKVYAPLNTSIQELNYQQSNRLENLERSLNDVRNLVGARMAPQQPSLPPNYDPDMPVTMAQFMEIDRRQREAEQRSLNAYNQTATENAYLRAHLSLSQYKAEHPDFPMTVNELDRAFHSTAARNPAEVRNANWTSMFDTLYNQTVLPKRAAELDTLKKQNEDLQRQLKEAKEGQRTQRQPEAMSPATRTISRNVIQSPTNTPGDLDVVNLRSFKKGASFKSYAGDLKRHFGIA